MRIEITGRLSDDIERYCRANDITPEDYCLRAVRERVALDKYGDLNDKVPREEQETAAKVTDTVVENKETSPVIELINTITPSPEKIEDGPVLNKSPETKKTHRILKTK